MSMSDQWMTIDLGPHILAIQSFGGSSPAPYGVFNLGFHVGDQDLRVIENRLQLKARFGTPVYFPEQVHGNRVIEFNGDEQLIQADAVVTKMIDRPVGILTADCLPVLFASQGQVGVAHVGWKGLVSGVLENTLATFPEAGHVTAWLGPCIGPSAFEVGPEVVDAFVSREPCWTRYFRPSGRCDHYFADLKSIALEVLENMQVGSIKQLDECTYTESSRWYSYRRDGVSGRMATCIMLTE